MKCPICSDEMNKVKARDKHLIVTKNFKDNHIHIHGDIGEIQTVKEMVGAISENLGVTTNKQLEKKEIVFRNRQRIGDILMFTCGVRDFKRAFPDTKVNVVSTASHIWDYNPNIDRSIFPTEDNMVKIGPGKLTNSSNRLDWHFANAYRVSIEEALGVTIPQGESRPDIWFTEEEYNAERLYKEPYWIICITGEKGWGCKMYPFERWQEFTSSNPDINFVQIGTKGDNPPKLQGDNIIDMVGMTEDRDTGIRDLFKLFLNAEGSIGLVSFHMHLSGALKKPSIVVAGAREPVSFTRYPGHQYLSNDGCLPCAATTACWKCSIESCRDLVYVSGQKTPKCVDMIASNDLTVALRKYYEGGRLRKGVVSEKPKLKNIVPTPPKSVVVDVSKYGMEWGGGCITSKDWDFMKNVFQKYDIKSVLEFGSGLSTLLMYDYGLEVKTYETVSGWIDKLKGINKDIDITLWDRKDFVLDKRYDFAFVDGPSGGQSREISTKIGAECADIVIIHDANREWEKKWQALYLEKGFKGPVKGGNRCHLWIKSNISSPKVVEPAKVHYFKQNDKPKAIGGNRENKLIKFVFNGRGEGGAEKSATWMMNKLAEMGYRVNYVSPNPAPCGTFRKIGDKSIIFENIHSLNEPCDCLVLYANDWIWEFPKQDIADVFNNVDAKRKVLCVNYKIGRIGILPWTKGWDSYLFLNNSFKKFLFERIPTAKAKTLAPPTDLSKYFDIKPDYSNGLRLIRHSSQGNSKYSKDFNTTVKKVLDTRDDVSIRLMPAPTFLENFNGRVFSHSRNDPPIEEYLNLGNCFWYSLPEGYTEGGPKVVMEAQAAGLPVIADNHSGMKDRVTEGTGWLCNTIDEHCKAISEITPDELRKRGEAARQYAREEYNPMNWIKEIIGD